jgi:hypothetical protein
MTSRLVHPLPSTPIVTDNCTASGIANDMMRQKWSKAMDMCFYLVHDQVCQGNLFIYWKKGILNHADYFTKHHPAAHHTAIHAQYLHCPHPVLRPPNYYACLDSDDAICWGKYHLCVNSLMDNL